MRLLFVCTSNRLRSPTAETLFGKDARHETRSAGTDENATRVIAAEDIVWADLIFVMESVHTKRLKKRFKDVLDRSKLITLGIPDEYERDDPELIKFLDMRVEPWLEA